ncbi:hypothetical protein IEO21_10134 [Rhodonia placenta]|uniref:Uncharacterized protein n=1 Tax=Rhodonia placenta TaxID=104341 RepID=A0A8H7TXL1_9APHY|nr:hypothetical protein IEO21_10134 [Postia placenta]
MGTGTQCCECTSPHSWISLEEPECPLLPQHCYL